MIATYTTVLPQVERLFGGKPLISPTGTGWESGVTFNSSALLLKASENTAIIRELLGPEQEVRDIVALHYRARPKHDPGFPFTRSYVGLSIHEPDLTPIRRLESPVLSPAEQDFADIHGAEDPRVTFLDGQWWMVYCGVSPIVDPDPMKTWLASVCVARSDDLVNWTKMGAVQGTSGRGPAPYGNKDGVLFPERIEGKVMLLHRPLNGDIDTWETAIAWADQPEGPYTDLGSVHGPDRQPDCVKSWTGAGAVPIKVGPGRYLSIEHTGNYLEGKQRRYVLDAFLYDFNDWDPTRPQTLVKARLDDFMRPETDFEVKGPFHDSVANVVFACGAYVHDGWIYIVYGGGDSYILAARVRYEDLLGELLLRELEGRRSLAGVSV
ncbi:MAG TPA: hypothetical protein VG944_13540 [Fimbriimonas sp.]|nr:hypothetical protein [Fimbriimonas sp.]